MDSFPHFLSYDVCNVYISLGNNCFFWKLHDLNVRSDLKQLHYMHYGSIGRIPLHNRHQILCTFDRHVFHIENMYFLKCFLIIYEVTFQKKSSKIE